MNTETAVDRSSAVPSQQQAKTAGGRAASAAKTDALGARRSQADAESRPPTSSPDPLCHTDRYRLAMPIRFLS